MIGPGLIVREAFQKPERPISHMKNEAGFSLQTRNPGCNVTETEGFIVSQPLLGFRHLKVKEES